MPSGSETITGKVNVAMLEKADRLFRQNLAALSGFSLPAKPTPATESGESDVKLT